MSFKVNSVKTMEPHRVGKLHVHVCRDDLQGDNKKLPPWGKLLYLKGLVAKLDKKKPLIALNVYGSWSGWALSAFCKENGLPFRMVHPNTKLITDEYLEKVTSNGGELHPLRPNMMAVLGAQMRNYGNEHGYQYLPYAFDHSVYLNACCKRMTEFLQIHGPYDNLVISSGSGVTTTAAVNAFLRNNPAGKVFAITVGTVGGVTKTLTNRGRMHENVSIIQSPWKFNDLMKDRGAPFPCNQFWDKKAWCWLEDNASSLKGQTLFWNLGGLNTFLRKDK